MSIMQHKVSWKNRRNLINFLARELVRGRLGFFLGAGVSQPFGLPSWLDLVDRLRQINGISTPRDTDDPIIEIGVLYGRFYDGRLEDYARDTRAALYKTSKTDPEHLNSAPLLAALGALLMNAARRGPAAVVTLNYDDLLETYLELHGFRVDAIGDPVHWANAVDVRIYHPHGLLPVNSEKRPLTAPVLGTKDYANVMAPDSLWRATVTYLLRTRTFLYVGLSGSDIDLQHVAAEVSKKHPSDEKHENYPYHGVLIGRRDMKLAPVLDTLGLFSHLVDDFNDIPNLLYEIGEAAGKFEIQPRLEEN